MSRATHIALLVLCGCSPRAEAPVVAAGDEPAGTTSAPAPRMSPGGGPVAPDGGYAVPRESLIGPGNQPVFDFEPPAPPAGTVRVELHLDGAAVASGEPGGRLVWDSSSHPDGLHRSELLAVGAKGMASPLGSPALLLVLNRGAKVANNAVATLEPGTDSDGPARACAPWTMPEGHASAIAVLRFADTSWKRVRAELGAGGCGGDGRPLAAAVSSNGLLVVEHADTAGAWPRRDRYLAVTAAAVPTARERRVLELVYSIYSH